MSTHEMESGDKSPGIKPEKPILLKRSNEISGSNPFLQRIQSKFRHAVGQAMETIADDDMRNGIKRIQQEVVDLLRKLQEESQLSDESLQLFEDHIIQAKVEAFIATTALDVERNLRSRLTEDTEALRSNLKLMQEKIEQQMYDHLTGVYLKEYVLNGFEKTLAMLQRESFSSPIPLSILFFDIDLFKRVNDTYGHLIADKVLAGIGKIVGGKFKRSSDIVGRFGGEEFVVVMPKCGSYKANELAEELREKIAEESFIGFREGEKKVEFNVTVSIGVLTAMLHKFSSKDIEELRDNLLKETDALMYKAKNSGRNRVIGSQIDIGEMPDDEGVLV
ncbi:GGDEF domain-containing protein [bacterium]|nr:GGDEF domain-containing protein [bacterium]